MSPLDWSISSTQRRDNSRAPAQSCGLLTPATAYMYETSGHPPSRKSILYHRTQAMNAEHARLPTLTTRQLKRAVSPSRHWLDNGIWHHAESPGRRFDARPDSKAVSYQSKWDTFGDISSRGIQAWASKLSPIHDPVGRVESQSHAAPRTFRIRPFCGATQKHEPLQFSWTACSSNRFAG